MRISRFETEEIDGRVRVTIYWSDQSVTKSSGHSEYIALTKSLEVLPQEKQRAIKSKMYHDRRSGSRWYTKTS